MRVRRVLGPLAGLLALALAGCGSGGRRRTAAEEYALDHGTEVLLVERHGSQEAITPGTLAEADAPHRLASGTKSFAGAVAIAAVQDGLLDLDAPAADLIPEWRADPRKARITARELLDQSSGLDPTAGLPAPDTFRAAIEAPADHEPGTTFTYGPNHFAAFTALLTRALHRHGHREGALEYLERRVLDPIGAHVSGWDRDARGHPLFSTGADLTAFAWARFGRLVARSGRWGGRQVLRADLVAQMLAPSPANPRYGLGWWRNPGPEPRDGTRPIPGAPADLVMAAGAGDQRLYVIPSRRLVAVRFGEDESFSDRAFLTALLHLAPGAAA